MAMQDFSSLIRNHICHLNGINMIKVITEALQVHHIENGMLFYSVSKK